MSEQTRFDTEDIIRGLELNLAAETARADRLQAEIDGLSALCKDYRVERDRAEAGCAALVDASSKLLHKLRFSVDREFVVAEAASVLGAVLEQPHPGMELLKELEELRAKVK
mgnify:CR=1 FL=1